jgi:hypothetical protein
VLLRHERGRRSGEATDQDSRVVREGVGELTGDPKRVDGPFGAPEEQSEVNGRSDVVQLELERRRRSISPFQTDRAVS